MNTLKHPSGGHYSQPTRDADERVHGYLPPYLSTHIPPCLNNQPLDGVADTANQSFEAATRIVKLFRTDRELIAGASDRAGSALRLHDRLQRNPFATSPALVSETGLTALDELQRLGIVEEITGRRRDHVFAYHRCLAILDEGASPLSTG